MTQVHKQAVLREILEEFSREVTVKNLSGGETPLTARLRDSYELLHAPTANCLSTYYTRGVVEALYLWCHDPLFFPDPSQLEPYMLSCFAYELKHHYSQRAEKLMADMSLQIYNILQEYFDDALRKRGMEPIEIRYLSMKGFQYYWILHLARDMTVEAAGLYRDRKVHEHLVDFNLPFQERCRHRKKQLDGSIKAIRSAICRDQLYIRLSAMAFACDDKLYTVLKNQLILSLRKWIGSLS